eukprot:3417375-Pleurochrysis_carterae.AAC.5
MVNSLFRSPLAVNGLSINTVTRMHSTLGSTRSICELPIPSVARAHRPAVSSLLCLARQPSWLTKHASSSLLSISTALYNPSALPQVCLQSMLQQIV